MSSDSDVQINKRPAISESDSVIKINLITQTGVGFCLFIFFLFIRMKVKWLYTPNTKNRPHHPGYEYNGYLNWIIPMLNIKDSQLLSIIGLDGFMMLQTFKLIYRFFFIICIFSVIPLCILYSRGINEDKTKGQMFFKISILNLEENNFSIYLPVLMVFLITILLFYMIHIYYKRFISLRQAYIRNPALLTGIGTLKKFSFEMNSIEKAVDYINLPSRTVFFYRLPSFLENDDELKEFVDALGIGEVDDCILVKNTRFLRNLIDKKEKIIRKIEKEINEIFSKLKRETKENAKIYEEVIEDFDGNDIVSSAIKSIENEDFDENDKVELVNAFMNGLNDFKNKLKNQSTVLEFEMCRLEKIYDSINEEKDRLKKETRVEKNVVELINENDVLFSRVDISRDVNFFSFGHLLKIGEHWKQFSLELPIGAKSGFVTFRNIKSANVITQTLIGSKIFSTSAIKAPAPNDVIWDNINKSEFEITTKTILGNIIYIIFSFVFFTIVFGLIGLLKLEKLEERFPTVIGFIYNYPSIKNSFDGVVAPLIYNVLLALAPIILSVLTYFEGVFSYSLFELRLMRKYSMFLLLNGFVALLFTSTFYDSILKIASGKFDIHNLMKDVGGTLISDSVFFFNTIIQLSMLGNIMILLKPVPLVIKYLLKFLGEKKTHREKIEATYVDSIRFGAAYPLSLLVFPITLVYSVIAPIIVLFGAMYYVFTYLIYKHEFMFALENDNEAGAPHWNVACSHLFISLIIFQIACTSHMIFLGYKIVSLILLLLIVCTVFGMRTVAETYKKSCNFYPINAQEESYMDEFTERVILSRKNILEDWNELMDKDVCDCLDIKQMGFYDETEATKRSPYGDPSMFSSISRFFFPCNFFRTLNFIKTNDKSNRLKLASKPKTEKKETPVQKNE